MFKGTQAPRFSLCWGGGSLAHSSRLTFCLKFVVPGILTLHRILALLFKGCGGFHYQRNVIRDPIHIALG